MTVDAKKQLEEINRIREVLIAEGLSKAGPLHPRELGLTLVALIIESHRQSSEMSDDDIREQIRGMTDFMIDNMKLIKRTEIN